MLIEFYICLCYIVFLFLTVPNLSIYYNCIKASNKKLRTKANI